MDVRRYLRRAPLTMALLLGACAGGSGSSGFDIRENFAIEQALDSQQCVDFEGLVICPAVPAAPTTPSPTVTATPVPESFTPTPPTVAPLESPSPTPGEDLATPGPGTTSTPTPTITAVAVESPLPTLPPVMQIEASFAGDRAVDCPPLPRSNACLLDFRFTARGFPVDAAYRVAVREDPAGSWTILPAPQPLPQGTQPAFTNPVEIGLGTGPDAFAPGFQFAVLVFLADREAPPPSVQRLADTGADFAYVTPVLEIATFGGL